MFFFFYTGKIPPDVAKKYALEIFKTVDKNPKDGKITLQEILDVHVSEGGDFIIGYTLNVSGGGGVIKGYSIWNTEGAEWREKMQLDVEESTPASYITYWFQVCNWQLPSCYYFHYFWGKGNTWKKITQVKKKNMVIFVRV